MPRIRATLAGIALLAIATSAMAQERNIQVQLLGGGYTHTANLNSTGPNAHFRPGYNIGTAVGFTANKYVGVHADFVYSTSEGLGAPAVQGVDINRFFVGAHVELRYPMTDRFSPFIFGGAGAVRIDQKGPQNLESFNHFTKAAGMFGAGMAYHMPNAPVDILAEGKLLTYSWNALGYNRNQWDLAYSLGFAYRFKI